MNYDYEQTAFSKCVMAGLATGIIIIPVNLIYNFIYRHITGFSMSLAINVTSIIFSSFILCMLASLLFYFIVPYLNKSKNIYFLLVLVITAVVIFSGFHFQRSDNLIIAEQFKKLYLGDVIISGLASTFLLPWLATHKNVFFN